MSKFGDVKMILEVAGKVHTFRLGDYTAIDARMFRNATGVRLAAAFNSPDLDGIAGLVWLARIADGEKVTYAEVAEEITWDAVDLEPDVDDEDDAAPTTAVANGLVEVEPGDADPEA